jgi:hypothetical protein
MKSIETKAFENLPELKVLEFIKNPIQKVNGQNTNDTTYQNAVFNAISSLTSADNEEIPKITTG